MSEKNLKTPPIITQKKEVIKASDVSFTKTPKILEKCYSVPDYLIPSKSKVFHRVVEEKSNVTVTIDNKEMISFGYCDYLSLSNEEEIKTTLIEHLKHNDLGISSSRAIAGNTKIHIELENKIAEFIGGESAILYMLGYMANIGTLPALVQSKDTIFIDKFSHASLLDGCQIAKAKGVNIVPYKHNDMTALEKKLKQYSTPSHGGLLVTDGVFSMDGDIAKLDKMYHLAKKYDLSIMVDDAHGFGVLGENGSGIAEHFGLQGKIDLIMGTLSKSIPLLGGYIVGKKEVIEYLKCTSRAYLFCLAVPPFIAKGISKALDIMIKNKSLREQLWINTKYVKSELSKLGFELSNTETPIISLLIRDYEKTFKLVKELENRGICVDPIVYPGVKKRESRIRLVINAKHTKEQINQLLSGLAIAARELDIISK
jgi:8-amino-7-oxononanoate synthase